MITWLKKAVKWYLKNSADSYVWTPSGMIPYIPSDSKKAA